METVSSLLHQCGVSGLDKKERDGTYSTTLGAMTLQGPHQVANLSIVSLLFLRAIEDAEEVEHTHQQQRSCCPSKRHRIHPCLRHCGHP